MSRVTLVTVPAATLGDLLVWHWSLAGNHYVLALVAGMTFFPLLIASAWLLVVTLLRLLARGARRPFARLGRGRAAQLTAVGDELGAIASAPAQAQAAQMGAPSDTREAPSRKIAA